MKPKAPATGSVDGAWWPASRDLTAELPSLLAVLAVRLERIERVTFNLAAWPPTGRRLAFDGSDVRLEGFGDGVVDVGSATNGPGLEVAECRYTASLWKAGADGLLGMLGVKADADKRDLFPVAQMLFSRTDTTCGHVGESKLIQLTNPILGEVSDQLSREEPLSEKDLYNAPVPRLCEHPAGNLKDGTLPGITANNGYVHLLARFDGTKNNLALGDLTGEGVTDAAAVFDCSKGGVNWPAVVVLYGPGPKVLGSVDLGDVTPAEHADVGSMTIKGRDLILEWQSYEGAGFCIRHWSGRIHWNGSKPTLLDLRETAPPEETVSPYGPTC